MMEPKEARAWLEVLRRSAEKSDMKSRESVMEALDFALGAVAPPLGAGRCDWVYLPDADLTPFEHLEKCKKLMNELQTAQDEEAACTVTADNVEMMVTVLLTYHSVLLRLHRERIKQEVQAVVQGIAQAISAGEIDVDGDNPTDGDKAPSDADNIGQGSES